ncbi:uncharacterized protein LOC132545639 [Ylistrum balloti]|uniref:uncharacterized protein LOC132545639 n=1 Tax=Ylistrum balloti TaxID=509963 RepID=UPI0029059207|nr:uncharacterized protein LOC132545639 [Ylistrum balloti]
MGELVRRLDYERRASHLFKKDPKARFLTKEFSQPVKSANALVQKSKVKALANLREEMKYFGIKHDQEKENLETFRKGLGLKSVNFQESRFQQTRCRSSMVVKSSHELSADRILRTVPSNYVLDFGPGNRPIYTTNDPKKVRRTLSASHSQASKPEPQQSYRSKSAFSRQLPRNTSRTPSSVNDRLSQPGHRQGYPFAKEDLPGSHHRQTAVRPQKVDTLKRHSSSFSDSDDDSVFEEERFEGVIENENDPFNSNQKSYRHLREEYSVKSKIIPDTHKENLKRLKNIELSHLHALGERVHKFTAGIHALASRRKYATSVISPLSL